MTTTRDLPADALARDALHTLTARRVVGHGLTARVGARAWKPPRFAPGAKLFARIGIANPWDPDTKEQGVGLGDVAMPQTRQPAPHLQPPAQKAPPKGPALPNIPSAPTRREPSEANAPSGKLAPKLGDVRRFDPAELRPKEAPKANAPPPPKPRPPTTTGTFGPGPTNHPVVKLPMRPGVFAPGVGAGPGPVTAPAAERAAPPAPPAATPAAPPPAVAPAAEPPKPAPAVNRKPRGPSAGLDDLFGMGADNTRIRLPKPAPAGEGEPPRPRRPVVTSPEELARLGVDRRPPPPKPAPKPAGVAPPAARDREPDSGE
ncbi:MAG: hypothetical protein EXR71_00495 [Myxococcales bacterium]|nr:hypothetical protein [Myxococcales bacterium]